MRRALFVVDPQKDLVQSVPFGDRIIPIINKIINEKKFDIIILSKNKDSEVHSDFQLENAIIFTKNDKISSFESSNKEGINVYDYLSSKNIDEIYVVGLDGDHNVKETSKDCSVFFKTYVIIDATRFISEMTPVVEDLAKDGVMIINSYDLNIFITNKK
jgi:nicotinamidase-related amidase